MNTVYDSSGFSDGLVRCMPIASTTPSSKPPIKTPGELAKERGEPWPPVEEPVPVDDGEVVEDLARPVGGEVVGHDDGVDLVQHVPDGGGDHVLLVAHHRDGHGSGRHQ